MKAMDTSVDPIFRDEAEDGVEVVVELAPEVPTVGLAPVEPVFPVPAFVPVVPVVPVVPFAVVATALARKAWKVLPDAGALTAMTIPLGQ